MIDQIPAPRRQRRNGLEVPEKSTPVPKRRRRGRQIAPIVAASLSVIVGLSLLGVSLYLHSVESDVKRVNAFDDVPEAGRPKQVEAAKGSLNFLLLGSDSRDPNVGTEDQRAAAKNGARTDTIIMLHLNKDHSKAQMISIPRDTWVYVPKSKNGKYGNTNAKINASFAWGGAPLMVQTVEHFTGVRINHVALVDFAGFKEIVNALGGVEIDVPQSFTTAYALNGTRHFNKGLQTMDGAAALDYARERHAFADGDFARIQHQQQVIMAILNKAASGGTLSSPTKLNAFLRATADSVTIDGTLNIVDMAMELRGLRGDDLTFYTSPTKGTGMMGSESVVLADEAKVKSFYDAVRNDQPLPTP
ncbi:LCP family protein [Dactylosporangium roseum]|uniref:LCP family protein n=1 Tax=Dactylosporangium roseum TaxID=47989 RepID=UPI0021B47033|nr:LCP family protein [Dactylosporangium roseum]